MVVIILDDTISSPLLRRRIGRIWSRQYNSVDHSIQTNDWEVVGFLLRAGLKIESPCYISYEIGKKGLYIQEILDRGIREYDQISYGAANNGNKHIIDKMVELGANTNAYMVLYAIIRGKHHIAEQMFNTMNDTSI